MKLCYVLRGLPGSGKTSWAQGKGAKLAQDGVRVNIVTADIWRIGTAETPLVYDRTRLRQAERECLRLFASLIMNEETQVLIVDKWNIWTWEYSPYMRLAEAFGYECSLMEFVKPVKECLEANTHRVPENEVYRLASVWDSVPPCYSDLTFQAYPKADTVT